MDVVISYVDGNDPLWIQDYKRYAGDGMIVKRYRDWGTLVYLMRCIGRNLPFVRKVHLLVARDSQVPHWVDRSVVDVVLHEQIMPRKLLPTFNSTTIEMFLHRIPGLDEEFLYFNDDMFPVMRCGQEDFYRDGKSAIGFSKHLIAGGKFKKRTRNSDRIARKALGMRMSPVFVRPQHTCSPMLRSQSEELYSRVEGDIMRVASRLRTTRNFNQYMYLDYLYYKGLTVSGKISNKHLSPAVHSPQTICSFIEKPSCKLICINDVHLDDADFARYRDSVTGAFASMYPDKSQYETL